MRLFRGTIRDPRVFAYRASLLLAVGRVDEADADIERALRLDPNDSDALALQTIIAVVQNEQRQSARLLPSRPSRRLRTPPRALIALSYAQQARFDLEGARASLQKAVELEPQNALAWARLAEIHSSFGEAGSSPQGGPEGGDPGAQSVTHPDRARVRLSDAGQDDNRPRRPLKKRLRLIRRIPSHGWVWGWRKIREGDLHEGSREIEIAASLDPNNSIIRSYLGKTYYEEKRTKLDQREYAVAKGLDPKDPTPWFYDAIAKQTTNRPVEALQDMQKAIELNDNRAVYRSRLLLDSDLAARSASPCPDLQ